MQQWHVHRNDKLKVTYFYARILYSSELLDYEKDKNVKKCKDLKTFDIVVSPSPLYSQNVTSERLNGLLWSLKMQKNPDICVNC